MTEKPLPLRSLKIIAESFAVQALALEKLPQSQMSNKTVEDRQQLLLKSMETAGDIALLYLQEQDKLQGILITRTCFTINNLNHLNCFK